MEGIQKGMKERWNNEGKKQVKSGRWDETRRRKEGKKCAVLRTTENHGFYEDR